MQVSLSPSHVVLLSLAALVSLCGGQDIRTLHLSSGSVIVAADMQSDSCVSGSNQIASPGCSNLCTAVYLLEAGSSLFLVALVLGCRNQGGSCVKLPLVLLRGFFVSQLRGVALSPGH